MRSIRCDICQIRMAKRGFRILTNERNITYRRISPQGKARRIKEGSRHLLCNRCETSLQWHGHGLTLESIKLTKKEIDSRIKKWKGVPFTRSIM